MWEDTTGESKNVPNIYFSTMNAFDVCFALYLILKENLQIRLAEGIGDERIYTFVDLNKGEDIFTFCSIGDCPKYECALPEQMVSVLNMK